MGGGGEVVDEPRGGAFRSGLSRNSVSFHRRMRLMETEEERPVRPLAARQYHYTPPGTKPLAAEMTASVDESSIWADENTVALHIDRKLQAEVWNGTRFTDRVSYLSNEMAKDLVGEVERSMLAQESYDEFEGRLFKNLGLDTPEPAGRLAKLNNQLGQEIKMGWNRALVDVNDAPDTIVVSEAELDDRTTQGCWDKHGTILADGEFGLYHWGCRCRPRTIPSPDSDNAEWAALGQSILEEMAEERDSGSALNESARPSRLFGYNAVDGASIGYEEAPPPVLVGAPSGSLPSRLFSRLLEADDA